MSEGSGNGDGEDRSTPSFGSSSGPFTSSGSPPLFSSSKPPLGSHEEPCGNCLSLLIKYWEERMRAEEEGEWPLSSFEPTSSFGPSLTSQPGLSDTSSPGDHDTKKPKAETVGHRRKTRRKMRSLPYNIALKANPGTSNRSEKSSPPSERSPSSSQNASTPARPPSKSREEAGAWKITLPAVLTQLTIPEMLAKLKAIEVPQIGIPDLPDIPPITLPEVPQIPLPELPKLPLPKIPTFNLPEFPRIELPKISFQDFPQIFNMRPRSQSAPVFSYASRSPGEEHEIANSPTHKTNSTDSPGVESWEWRD